MNPVTAVEGLLALAALPGIAALVRHGRAGSPAWAAYDDRQFTRPITDFHPSVARQLFHEFKGDYFAVDHPIRARLAGGRPKVIASPSRLALPGTADAS